MALIATLIMGVHGASSAEDSFTNPQASVLNDEFCGTTPPAITSCPKTGLSVCKCYLSPSQEVVEFSPLDHPPVQKIRITVKPKLVILLPEIEAHQIQALVLAPSLERPPQ